VEMSVGHYKVRPWSYCENQLLRLNDDAFVTCHSQSSDHTHYAGGTVALGSHKMVITGFKAVFH